MLPSAPTPVGASIDTSGPVSLVQGVYGDRGNLELVTCDATDGLWVFWFNADDADPALASAEVPPGSWSAGLRFARGARYVDAQILQSALGPDHLEVLALRVDGVLESWYWSPGPGFQRRTADAATGVAAFGAAHERGVLTVTVREQGGRTRHFISDAAAYPHRTWRTAPAGPGLAPDATEAVIGAGAAIALVRAGSARAARSTRNGGMTELTWRDVGGGIRHLGVPDDGAVGLS